MAAEPVEEKMVRKVTRPGIKTDEMLDIYKTWAKEYDKDLNAEEYTGPGKVAAALAQALGDRREVRILDVAAGTGLCGEELFKVGFTNLDALDASQDMLDVAKTKNVYKNFLKDFLGPNRLHIEDDTYDVVTGSGLFAEGHVKSDCLEELIRVVKPGGLICIAILEKHLSAYSDIEVRMGALQSGGFWERISREVSPGYCYRSNGVVYVNKVL